MGDIDLIMERFDKIEAALLNKQATQPAVEERLITRDEACKIFIPSITRQTLSNYCKSGAIKVYRLGGRLFFKKSEIIGAAKELKQYKKEV